MLWLLENKNNNYKVKLIFDLLYNLIKYKKNLISLKNYEIPFDVIAELDKILNDDLKLSSIIEKKLIDKYFINDVEMIDNEWLTLLWKDFLLFYKEKISNRYKKNWIVDFEFFLKNLHDSLEFYGIDKEKLNLIIEFLKYGQREK